MRNIFELTKPEQRVAILIVTLLVTIAFAKHAWQARSSPVKTPTTEATLSPRQKPEESSGKSRN